MNKFYIVTDSEAGGIGKDKSLLTAYFGVFDSNFQLVDELDLRLKPDDGIYKVTGQGLEVNKINLAEHDKVAITYKQGGTELYNFLGLQGHLFKNLGKLIPLGHNVGFDIEMYQEHLLSRGSWESYVSYRVLDTMTVARFLQDIGKLPFELGISLGNLISHFDIEVEGEQHQAKYDAIATLKVYQKLRELV